MNFLVKCVIAFLLGFFVSYGLVSLTTDTITKTAHEQVNSKLDSELDSTSNVFITLIYERGYDQGIEWAQDSVKSRKEHKWKKDSTNMANTINGVRSK